MRHYQVVFLPSGRKGWVDKGTILREAARTLGVDIETICGGRTTCGKCKVRVLEGTFDEHEIHSSMAHLSPMSQDEKQCAEKYDFRQDERAACVTRVLGDVVVFVPEESRVGRPVVLKTLSQRAVDIVPSVRKHYLVVPSSSLKDPAGDWERLAAELKDRFHLEQLGLDHSVLQSLSGVLEEGRGEITVTVWQDKEVIRIEPGYVDKAYGLAVDLGTTTMAGYLCDLASGEVMATASMINPQIEFGEDVMTRIVSARGKENLAGMNQVIIDAVGSMARDVTQQASLSSRDISEMVLVGNTVMHHIFLGLDVQSLGKAPFTPLISGSVNAKARELGLDILPSANVHVLPLEAGFVGADNVAVLISEAPYNQDEQLLIIDLGTNGELLVGNRHRVLSASCATGPAFEGGSIRFGMRAAPGAIEKVRVDPKTHAVRFRVIGNHRWHTELPPKEVLARGFCGSGIMEAVAEMVLAGIITKNGSFDKSLGSSRLRQRHDDTWEYVIALAEESAIGEDITVTQHDIRAIQLAKGAVYAGSKLLLERLALERPDKVILAGAFGTVVDPLRALVLGLFPDPGLDNIIAVGNAAGDGARLALLNKEKRIEADRVAREVEYVELTLEPGFMQTFVDATPFPHSTDSFPSLT